jgi:Transposase, Mutator family
MYARDEHFLVVRAVEDANVTAGRQALGRAPQIVVIQLSAVGTLNGCTTQPCGLRPGTIRNFVREAVFRHWPTNLSPKTTANWVLASNHSRGGRFHSSAALLKTKYSSFIAASSFGKCPLTRTARRSLAFSRPRPNEVFAKDGPLDDLKKALSERILNAELDEHLDGERVEGGANRRNGHSKKSF